MGKPHVALAGCLWLVIGAIAAASFLAAAAVDSASAADQILLQSKKSKKAAKKQAKKSETPDAATKPDGAATTRPGPTDGATLIALGGKADRACMAAAGRLVICHLEGASQLTVVDISQRKIVKQIPSDRDSPFAGSRSKLVVIRNSPRLIERWDLLSLEKDKTVLLENDKAIRVAAMGGSGNGPVAIWPEGKLQFWDLETLKPLTVSGGFLEADKGNLWPSADGLTFCAWGWTSGPFQMLRLSGLTREAVRCERTETLDSDSHNEAWAMPSTDGSQLIDFKPAIYNRELVKQAAENFKGATLLPTSDPRFLLALRRTGEDKLKRDTLAIVAAADLRVLWTVQDLEPLASASISTRIGRLGTMPRANYLPTDRLLYYLPDGDTTLVVRSFDLAQSLFATGAEYLYVISNPSTRGVVATPYSYQVQTMSRAGGVTYQFGRAPAGMLISNTGLLTWKDPVPSPGGKATVSLNLKDAAGQVAAQTFEIVFPPALPGESVVADDTGVMTLLPQSAALAGKSIRVERDGGVGNWSSGEAATWIVSPRQPGRFEIVVEQSARMADKEYEVSCADQVAVLRTLDTQDDRKLKLVHVGVLQLPAGPSTLQIKRKGYDGTPIRITSVQLKPTTSPVSFARRPRSLVTADPTKDPGAAARVKAARDRLVGVWLAKPAFDVTKSRKQLIKDGVPADELNAAVAQNSKTMANFTVTYSFEADGTAKGTVGPDGVATGGPATWEVLAAEGQKVLLRLTPEGKSSEELMINTVGADRFSMPLVDDQLPVQMPLVFNRVAVPPAGATNAPSKAAGIAPTARNNANPFSAHPASQPASSGRALPQARMPQPPVSRAPETREVGPPPEPGGPELTKLGEEVAKRLEHIAMAQVGNEVNSEVVSLGYALQSAEKRGDDDARVRIHWVETLQPDAGGNIVDRGGETVIDLRRSKNLWVVSGIRASGVDRVGFRGMAEVGREAGLAVLDAQGQKVVQGKPMQAGDKPAGPANPAAAQMAKSLGDRLRSYVKKSHSLNPDFSNAQVSVDGVQRTPLGLSLTFTVVQDFSLITEARGNPAEMLTVRTVVHAVLRSEGNAKYSCWNAQAKVLSTTNNRGPLDTAVGQTSDLTIDFQQWLSEPPAANQTKKP